jgi:tetratricopeptide (TPR) repeat protein
MGVQLTESEIQRTAWRYDPNPGTGVTSELKFAFDFQRNFGFRLVEPPEAEPILESLKANRIYHPEIDYRRDPQGQLMPLPARFDPESPAKETLRKMRDMKTEVAEVDFETEMAFYQATSGTYIPLLFEIPAEQLRWKRNGADVTVFGLIEAEDGRRVRHFEEHSTITRPQGGKAVVEMPVQLEPGSYTFNLGVMDLESKKIGTKRTPVFVPSFKQDELDRSSVLLYRESRRVGKPAGTLGHAFQFGQVKFTPAGGRAYRPKDNLGILFFVYGYGVGDDGQAKLTSDYTLYLDGEKQGEIPTQSLQVGSTQAFASVQIPMATFETGDYQVEIQITDHVTGKSLSDRFDFVLEPEPYAVGEYSELVESYRAGRFEEAARAIALVPRSSIKGTAKGYRKTLSDNEQLKAGALLHTEAAITTAKEVVFHLDEARKYLDRISDRSVRNDNLRRWFIAVARYLRSSPLGWGALSVVDEALELYPNDMEIQLAVGSVYESAGRRQIEGMLDRAEGLYRVVLEKRPDNVEAHLRLGRVLQLKGNWAEAIRELDWSLEHGDDHSIRFVTLMLMGDVYYQLGDLQNAVRSYRGALEIDPGCQVAAVALSHALHRLGEWAGSREVMSRFLDREESPSGGRDEWQRYVTGSVDQLYSVLQEMREEVLR